MAPRTSLLFTTCVLARAARLWERSEGPSEGVDSASPNGEIICGDYQIWSTLTASSSPTAVRNMQWGRIASIAEDFLHDRRIKKEKLETELKLLQDRITQKKEAEQPQLTTREELEKLIEDSLISFRDPENAQPKNSASASNTKCGKPFTRPRAPKGAYQESKKAFERNADAFFDKSKRLDRALFQEVCKGLLPPPKGESSPGVESYCAPLCQFFHDTAKAFSNERAGETGGLLSDDLIKTLMMQKVKLTAVQGDIKRCESATARIAAFRGEIEELKKVGDECVEELQEAEYALDDAQFNLEDLTEQLGQQELLLAAAEEALTGDDAKVTKAKEDIEATEQLGADLKAKLKEVQARLAGLSEGLRAAEEVTQVSFDLKLALEAVMQKMTEFFDEAALEPLRFMGLDEDCKVADYFNSAEKQEAEGKAIKVLGEGVDSLSTYCETTAKAAFAAVEDSVDLKRLCEFGEPGAVKSGALEAVKAKEKMFVDELTDILSWLNPYRSPGLSEELARQRVESGESMRGFQEVISVYSGTEFFKYLKAWQEGGEFAALLGELAKLVGKLKQAKEKAEREIAELEKSLAAVGPQLATLVGDLEAAEAAKVVSQGAQGDLSAAVKGLQQNSAQMNDLIAKLLERVRKAQLACAKVDTDLEAALQTLTSKWAAGLLEAARTERRLAGQRLQHMRHLVASSERSLLAAQAAATEG